MGDVISFEDAKRHEVKVEDACRSLALDAPTTSKILQSYRFDPSLLHTVLEHNGDHVGYVKIKLDIMERLGFA